MGDVVRVRQKKMSRQRLDAAIEKIRFYTRENTDLHSAHHFLYDLPLDKNEGKPDFVVMGINPGEGDHDKLIFVGPTEETWNYDFHSESGIGPSLGRIKWHKNAEYFTGSRRLVFSELFFWSSANGEESKKRFGQFWRSRHLLFCAQLNKVLIDEYQPKAVIVAGVGAAERVDKLYNLKYAAELKDGASRLVLQYSDGCRPWFFTKHWSASFGFSKKQKENVKNFIQNNIRHLSEEK